MIINLLKALVKYFIVFCFVFSLPFLLQAKISTLDSLKKDSLLSQVISTPNQKDKATVFRNIAYLYYQQDIDSCYHYCSKSLTIAKALNDSNLIAEVNWIMGSCYEFSENYHQALEHFEVSYKNISSNAPYTRKITCLTDIGEVLVMQNRIKPGLDKFLRALELAEKHNDSLRMATCLNRMGVLYSYIGSFEKAKEYHEKSIELKVAIKSYQGLGYYYYNYGMLLLSNGKNQNALEIINNSFTYISEGDNRLRSLAFNLKGTIYLEMNKLDSALQYFKQASSYDDQSYANSTTALSILNQSKAYFLMNKYPLAKEKALAAIEMMNMLDTNEININELSVLTDGYLNLSATEEKLDNPIAALNYFKKYKTYYDKKLNQEYKADIQELESKYNFEKKEREIDLLRQSNKQAKLEMEQANLAEANAKKKTIISYGFSVLFLFIISIFFWFNRKNTQLNKKLHEKNEHLEVALEENKLLFKEIHHRVKNNLQMISSLLSLQSKTVHNIEALNVLRDGQDRVKSVALIHQELYQNKAFSSVNFWEYANQLISNIESIHNSKINRIEVINKAPKDLRFDIDTAIPLGLILNEFLTNSYKYAFKGTHFGLIEIEINPSNKKDFFELIYKDNGVGLPNDFSLTESNSFGMKLIVMLTKQLRGHIEYQNQNGAYFTILFAHSQNHKKVA